jgi:hypothetical protein
MKSNDGKEVPVLLYSDIFAQSAFDNDVSVEDFKLSMDAFSASSTSPVEVINAWRDEAVEIFFKLLEESGKITWKAAEFLGGSDYEEDNGTTPDIDNTNT